jgi:hypothetical protein
MYHAKLIAMLASIGSLEDCFYARMCTVFVENRNAFMSWLDMLKHSTAAGHDVATFIFSLVLYRSNSGAGKANIARRWLRKVKGDEAGPTVNVMWKNKIRT